MKQSKFKGVGSNVAKGRREGSNKRKYLKPPKGTSELILEEDERFVKLDFLLYEVTGKKHPDRDDNEEVAIPGSLWWKRPYMLHRNVGPENRSYVCLRSLGKKCPICEYQATLWDTDKKGAIALYPQDRTLFAVKKPDEDEVMVWNMADKLVMEEFGNQIKEDPEKEIFPSLDEGLTLQLKFKWDKIGEKGKAFPEVIDISFLERKEQYDEDILKSVPNLDEIIENSCLEYEELRDAFFTGEDVKKDEDEEEDDEPRKSKKKEEDDDDDEDDEPKPSKKKSVKEDEDEDNPPARSERKPVRTSRVEKPKETEKKKEVTLDDLDEMSLSKLERFIDDNDLDIKVSDYDDDVRALRQVIAKRLGLVAGKKPEKEAEPERKSKKPEKESDTDDEECPSGYKFGKDTDKYDECADCALWDKCDDAKNKKKK